MKEKKTEDISMEIVVCGAVVQTLIIGTVKMVDLERFTSTEKLLRVRNYV